MRLAAGLHPDLLGSHSTPPDIIDVIRGRGKEKGKERVENRGGRGWEKRTRMGIKGWEGEGRDGMLC